MGRATGGTEATAGGPSWIPVDAGSTAARLFGGSLSPQRLEVEEALLPDGRRVARYRHDSGLAR